MDYKRIHDTFIGYFRITDPRDRLLARNASDVRLVATTLYTETHHILPRSQGGEDDIDNLVRLLPEEHIFIHSLRYKAFAHYGDLCAVQFCLNGRKRLVKFGVVITKDEMLKYSLRREQFAKYIKMHNAGSVAISEARKGTMPVKDANTGIMMGSVSIYHPNVLSGEWVHHSTGRKYGDDVKNDISKRVSGFLNPNAYNITNEEYLEQAIRYVKETGGIFVKSRYFEWCVKMGLVYIKSFSKIRFSGSSSEFIKQLQERCNERNIPFTYDKWYRGHDTREMISKSASGKVRVYQADGTYKLEKLNA